MKHFLVCLTLCAAGCSDTPTSPTVVSTPAVPPAVSSQTLRWDVIATGCAATRAPVPLPDPNTGNLTKLADGSISGSWPYRSRGTSVLLYARFIDDAGLLALCTWDIADL